jgi:hypothetical protein
MVASALFLLGWPVNIAQPVLQEVPSFVKWERPRNAALRNYPGTQAGTAVARSTFYLDRGPPRDEDTRRRA